MSTLSTVDDVWSVPVDDYSLMRGENWNADYVANGFEPQYFWGDRLNNFIVTVDSQPIRNYDKILALLLRNNDQLTTAKLPTNGNDRYDLISKAQDIVYVSRYIDSYIVSVSTSSVCNLTVPVSQKIGLYDARFIINNLGGKLVCKITLRATGIEHIRAFSISGQTITLLDPITGNTSGITGLTANDRFELLNAFDVLQENLEATTGYPVKGYVKKHIVPNDNAYIIFNQYDKPFKIPGEYVAISYRALDNYDQAFIYDDSIRHYGLYTYRNELNFAVTQTAIDYIASTLKVYSEPQITVEWDTYRPTKPKRGWPIIFNVTGVVVGILIITDVKEVYISPKGQRIGKGVRLWRVTAQNYVDTLPKLIADLQRKNTLSQAILAPNNLSSSFTTFNVNFSFIDNPVQIYVCENLVSSGVGPYGFTVDCDSVPGASGYIYRISTHSDFRDAPTGFNYPSPVSTPSVTIYSTNFILPSTTYYFDMAAIINGVATAWASLPSVTTSAVGLSYEFDIDANTEQSLLFQDGSGTTAQDATANNRDGTITNGTWVTGTLTTKSISLPGSGNSRVETGNVAALNPSSFTIKMMFRLPTITSQRYNITAKYEGILTPGSQWAIEYHHETTPKKLVAFIYKDDTSGHYLAVSKDVTLAVNKEYVMAYSWNNTTKAFELEIGNVTDGTLFSGAAYIDNAGMGGYSSASSITSVQSTSAPIYVGAFRKADGSYDVDSIIATRSFFSSVAQSGASILSEFASNFGVT